MKNSLKFLFCLLVCFNAVPVEAFFDVYESNPVLSYTRLNTFDKYRVSNPKVINDGLEYKMYYSGLSDQNKVQIGLATSADGLTWSRYSQQPVFKCNENLSSSCVNGAGWSGYRVGVVDVIFKDGKYHMWYVGNSSNSGSSNYLGYASSNDGVEWVAYQDNPVYPDYASSMIEFQSVIYFGDRYYLYYRLNDGLGTYLASSADGIIWVNENGSEPINSGYILSIGVHDGTVYGFIDGIFYYSKDAKNFERSNLSKVTDSPQVEGTMLFMENQAKLWSTKGTGFEFGGFFNTVINYYTSSIDNFSDIFNQKGLLVSNLKQLRADGRTAVVQGGEVVGNAVVFRAAVENPSENKRYALEVEVKRVGESFDGAGTFVGEYGEDTVVSTKVRDFIRAADLYVGNNRSDFQWRARVKEESGDTSEWVEFGEAGTDFSLRAVPLITQQPSPYPNIDDTSAWAGKSYAFSRSPECKNTIKGCGCALSALTTLARFHGVTLGVDGTEINPDNLNEWLKANQGYDDQDNIKFHQALKYFGTKIQNVYQTRFTMREHHATTPSEIRSFVGEHGPTVANARPTGFTHFFVLDSLLDEGYEVSDPFWYGTDTSNDTKDAAKAIQDYDDSIASARLIEVADTPMTVARGLEIHLASPATLVITDALGRRLGYDPRSDTTYNEIPTGEYWAEADISTEEAEGPVHETKTATVLNPDASPYTIEVIGESTGEYHLSVFTDEVGGESMLRDFASSTSEGVVHRYVASYQGDQTYEENALLQSFIDWLKSNQATLPKGMQKTASDFITRYEPQAYAGVIILVRNQLEALDAWQKQHNPSTGFDMVQRVIRSFE